MKHGEILPNHDRTFWMSSEHKLESVPTCRLDQVQVCLSADWPSVKVKVVKTPKKVGTEGGKGTVLHLVCVEVPFIESLLRL